MADPNSGGTTPPATSSSPWEKMLGPTLIQHNNNKSNGTTAGEGGDGKAAKYKTISTVEALKDKELVLLYFSASWCPPCQSFSPILKSFYALASDQIEIVYISSDQSIHQFDEYYGKMTWLSLPTSGTKEIKNALASSMKINGIPALIVMTKDGGLFVTDKAREQVTACMRYPTSSPSSSSTSIQENAKELVRQWVEDTKAVPLSDAKLGSSPGGIMGFIYTLLKNPAAIFALLYFVKWFMRKHQTLTQQGEEQLVDDVELEEADDQPEF